MQASTKFLRRSLCLCGYCCPAEDPRALFFWLCQTIHDSIERLCARHGLAFPV